MEIMQILEIAADQHEMISTVEDSLDQVITEILAQTEFLADDELENVQAAAALPFVEKHDKTGNK